MSLNVLAILDSLKPGEVQIIRLLYGLEDGVQHSHEAVASVLGLQVEEIKMVEVEVLRKLSQEDSPN